MKSIKSFKYAKYSAFEKFLKDCGYTINDVVGYSINDTQQYHGNVFKEYVIYFSDHDNVYFKAAVFKDFHEYHQSRLGFNGNRLFDWWEDADIKTHK